MEGSRRYFVGGNWKCNGTVEKNRELINDVINKLEFDASKVGKRFTKAFPNLWKILVKFTR
jgi:triosephosphate isomerase